MFVTPEEGTNLLKHVHPPYDRYKALVDIIINGRESAVEESCKHLQIGNRKNKHQYVEWDVADVVPELPGGDVGVGSLVHLGMLHGELGKLVSYIKKIIGSCTGGSEVDGQTQPRHSLTEVHVCSSLVVCKGHASVCPALYSSCS